MINMLYVQQETYQEKHKRKRVSVKFHLQNRTWKKSGRFMQADTGVLREVTCVWTRRGIWQTLLLPQITYG